MFNETAVETCELCGRATELATGRLCPECTVCVEPASRPRMRGLSRTWLVTLLLISAGTTAYYLIAQHYGRDIFWYLVAGKPLW